MTNQEAKDLYQTRNNAAVGFPVGSDEDNINEIEGIGELMETLEGGQLCLYSGENEIGPMILVADMDGPWGVEV